MRASEYVIIGLVVFEAMLAAVSVAGPESLSIPAVAVNWAHIVNVGVVVLINQMRALGSSDLPAEPEEG